jgi:tetratricopeptide (TPR) repeat protein
VLLLTTLSSQATEIDSLKRKLSLSANEKDKVNIMVEISDCFFQQAKIDSSFAYGMMAADLSRQINWPLGEAKGLHMTTAYTFFIEHNYIKCLSNCLYALTVFERENDSVYVLRSFGALASIYFLIEELSLAVFYNKKMIELAKTLNYQDKILEGTYGLANNYYMLRNTDSSVMYFQEGARLTNLFSLVDSNFGRARSYFGLAKASYLSHDYEIALSFLNKASSYAKLLDADLNNIKGSIQSTYIDIFMDLKQWDSALHRIKLARQVGNSFEGGMFDYYEHINAANVFEHINKDSAIKYYRMAHQVRTTFNSTTRNQLNSLAQTELERQRVIAEKEQVLQKSRTRNIQYTAIAIGLGTLIIFFLLYSRSIIGKEKLIRYLGVMLLLIVFEFLNLYLHPFLARLTGESPLLMLLTMVAIASLLIPAHHRTEHWVSHQLVEKNKRIRLQAAKKTIANLEAKGDTIT